MNWRRYSGLALRSHDGHFKFHSADLPGCHRQIRYSQGAIWTHYDPVGGLPRGRGRGAGRWGAAETAAAGWIDRCAVSDPAKLTALPAALDAGEREVIGLADETHTDLVIMDEAAGRRELSRRGLVFLGTVGVLILGKQRQLLAALKPELDQLRACGFHLSDRVYGACLASVGE